MPKGFVYILSNPAMPSLLKIGFSTNFPSERAAELSTTGVPSAFIVEYYCIVENAEAVERNIHERLHRSRHNIDREFFTSAIGHAITTIEDVAISREVAWRRSTVLGHKEERGLCPKCNASYQYAKICPKCQVRIPQ